MYDQPDSMSPIALFFNDIHIRGTQQEKTVNCVLDVSKYMKEGFLRTNKNHIQHSSCGYNDGFLAYSPQLVLVTEQEAAWSIHLPEWAITI
jgi:hypothetical protein